MGRHPKSNTEGRGGPKTRGRPPKNLDAPPAEASTSDVNEAKHGSLLELIAGVECRLREEYSISFAEKDKKIEDYSTSLAEKDKEIEDYLTSLAQKDKEKEAYLTSLAEKDQQLKHKDAVIESAKEGIRNMESTLKLEKENCRKAIEVSECENENLRRIKIDLELTIELKTNALAMLESKIEKRVIEFSSILSLADEERRRNIEFLETVLDAERFAHAEARSREQSYWAKLQTCQAKVNSLLHELAKVRLIETALDKTLKAGSSEENKVGSNSEVSFSKTLNNEQYEFFEGEWKSKYDEAVKAFSFTIAKKDEEIKKKDAEVGLLTGELNFMTEKRTEFEEKENEEVSLGSKSSKRARTAAEGGSND